MFRITLFRIFVCLNGYFPWFMNIHVYYIQEYSWCNFTFMNMKTGIIHEYSRIYTMNRIILEYS